MKVLWLEGFASCVTKSSQGLHTDTAPVLLGPSTSGERGGQVSAFRGEAGPPHSVTSKHRALGSNGGLKQRRLFHSKPLQNSPYPVSSFGALTLPGREAPWCTGGV